MVVDVPSAAADQPSWLRVGVFAVIGFVVGVGWPRIAGVRLGPSAPAPVADQASSGARPTDPPPSLPANLAAVSPSAVANAANAASAGSAGVESGGGTVEVKHGVVLSCTSENGERLKGGDCGRIDFDSIAMPKLKKMAQCPTADGMDGKLSVLFALDFQSNKVRVELGRSTTVENKDTFATCLRNQFDNVSLGAMGHDQQRYLVSYSLHFAPRGSVTPAAGGTESAPSAAQTPATPTAAADVSGDSAEVVWQVAIVRDAPRTGATVARLPRGTTVKIAGGQEGWFKIHYGQTFQSEGWVYRGAIGR